MASSSSSFTHKGINPGGGQVLVAQGLLDQAQVFGGPEQSVAKLLRPNGGRDRPCLSIMNEKGRPFGLPTENPKPKTVS